MRRRARRSAGQSGKTLGATSLRIARPLGTPVIKQFVNGEGFAYLGRNYRLQLVDDQDAPVKLERGRLRMRHDAAYHGASEMRGWYLGVGESWLRQRIRPWAARMRAEDVELRVNGLGYRWGSTRGHERINIHWATLQLRPTLIDYVLVHELAHLHEASHTQSFWDRVERVMPDFERRKNLLASVGSTVWIGETTLAT